MFLHAFERPIQRQLRRVEGLNRLDRKNRHAGIKPCRRRVEKRGESISHRFYLKAVVSICGGLNVASELLLIGM
jgi:hypothetical protein